MDERLQRLINEQDVEVGSAWLEKGAALLANLPGTRRIDVAAASNVQERNVALATLLRQVARGGQGHHRFNASPDAEASSYRQYWIPFIEGLRLLIEDADILKAKKERWDDERRAAEEWGVPVEFVRIRLRDWEVDLLAETKRRVRSLEDYRGRGKAVGAGGKFPSFQEWVKTWAPVDPPPPQEETEAPAWVEPPPPEEPAIPSSGWAPSSTEDRRNWDGEARQRASAGYRAECRRRYAEQAASQPPRPAPPPVPMRRAAPPAIIYLPGVPGLDDDVPPPEAPASEAAVWGRRTRTLQVRVIQQNWNQRETERLVGQDGDGI